jgi:hypothetical protein
MLVREKNDPLNKAIGSKIEKKIIYHFQLWFNFETSWSFILTGDFIFKNITLDIIRSVMLIIKNRISHIIGNICPLGSRG